MPPGVYGPELIPKGSSKGVLRTFGSGASPKGFRLKTSGLAPWRKAPLVERCMRDPLDRVVAV